MIGYMGSGKTTVGKKLAAYLSLSFIDLDHFIEGKYMKTIPQLFEEFGEEKFRKIESVALQEVTAFEDVVVSTGGGTPCFYDNMEVMNNSGVTVYIEADAEELTNRLMASKGVRPLIKGKSREELLPFVAEHLAERDHFYNEAKIIYHTDRMITKEQVYLTVEGIAEELRNIYGENERQE